MLLQNFIKKLLNKLSRVIYHLTPREFKNELNLHEHYKKEQQLNSYNFFKKYFKKSILFKNSSEIRKYSIDRATQKKEQNLCYLEFGVFNGTSINFFSNFVHEIYGFDSFEGLNEDWIGNLGFSKGHFDLKNKLPKVNANVNLIQGKVQDTLDNFIEAKIILNNLKINFIHMDLDTYESSLFVLKKIKPYLVKNSIILFDQLHNFEGWDTGELKALNEVFDDNEYNYIAFSMEHQAAILIN